MSGVNSLNLQLDGLLGTAVPLGYAAPVPIMFIQPIAPHRQLNEFDRVVTRFKKKAWLEVKSR